MHRNRITAALAAVAFLLVGILLFIRKRRP